MLKLQDHCVALQDLLVAMQAGSGWGSLQPSLQHLQSCPGSGQTWLFSGARTIQVLPWGWTRLDRWALHEAVLPAFASAGRANTGEGKRRCQPGLCTCLWDEECSAETSQKFAVVESKFD